MTLTFISIMVSIAMGAWWLSGYDSKLTGVDKDADLTRRFVRSGITVLVMGFGVYKLLTGGVGGGFIFVIVCLPLAVVWMSCFSEFFARGVDGVLEHHDDRQHDSRQSTRDLDRLAGLIRDHRHEEAMALCEQLRGHTEVSSTAMETIQFQLFNEKFGDERLAKSPLLSGVQNLRGQRRFTEAVAQLNGLLQRDSTNVNATFLLMKVYAHDLHQPDQALAMLLAPGAKSHLPPAFAEYANRCIKEWSGGLFPRVKSVEGIESILVKKQQAAAAVSTPAARAAVDARTASPEELLAAGQLSTAIDVLERNVQMRPDDFDSRLKLAEAHGVYCHDLSRAARIIDKIIINSSFNTEQIVLAKSKLREWRDSQR